MATEEDKRTATQMTASLASYLMTAALAVIAAQAAFVTFVLDKREMSPLFLVCSFVGAGASVASVYYGGKGIGKLAALGYKGEWVIKTPKGHFNKQTITSIIGLVFVVASIFFGKPKAEVKQVSCECEVLNDSVAKLQSEMDDLKLKTESLSAAHAKKPLASPPRRTSPH